MTDSIFGLLCGQFRDYQEGTILKRMKARSSASRQQKYWLLGENGGSVDETIECEKRVEQTLQTHQKLGSSVNEKVSGYGWNRDRWPSFNPKIHWSQTMGPLTPTTCSLLWPLCGRIKRPKVDLLALRLFGLRQCQLSTGLSSDTAYVIWQPIYCSQLNLTSPVPKRAYLRSNVYLSSACPLTQKCDFCWTYSRNGLSLARVTDLLDLTF